MAIWFTADHHFGHANIIKHCSRPFADVHEMNTELARRWNERVATQDTVYHVGDFAFRDHDRYLPNLNGVKHLIIGNHDPKRSKIPVVTESPWQDGWSSVNDMLQVSVDGTPITLCHYAMRVWNRSHHGALHLYGHSHGTLPGNSQSLDVGVDCWDFYPVTLKEIRERLATLPKYGGPVFEPQS